MGCAGSTSFTSLIDNGGFTADTSTTASVTAHETVIECKDPSHTFLGVFQRGALQSKSATDSEPTDRTFDVLVDGEVMYELVVTAIQKANEVGAKYTQLRVKSKADGKNVVAAKNEIQPGNKTKPWPIFTYEPNKVADSSTASDSDGTPLYAFAEAIKHGGDAEGNFKKNTKPKVEYQVGGETMMIGSTGFIKEYYFHGKFSLPSEEGAIGEFTYLQKNVKDEKGDWTATVWRSMRCSASVDALGLFVAGLALEQQWYWGFAMDED